MFWKLLAQSVTKMIFLIFVYKITYNSYMEMTNEIAVGLTALLIIGMASIMVSFLFEEEEKINNEME